MAEEVALIRCDDGYASTDMTDILPNSRERPLPRLNTPVNAVILNPRGSDDGRTHI